MTINMSLRQPIAFMSYVRVDDMHDGGRISAIRTRLEGEVRIQTGKDFSIFQDRNDLLWGDQWKDRIKSAVMDSTFLIPIITPSYFGSYMCKVEFDDFLIREQTLGQNDLILPIYYLESPEMSDGNANEIGKVLRDRNYIDLRDYRFTPLDAPNFQQQIANLAAAIVKNMARVAGVLAVARAKVAEPPLSELMLSSTFDEPTIRPAKPRRASAKRRSTATLFGLATPEWPEIRPYSVFTRKFDEIIRPSEITDLAEISKLQSLLNKQVRIYRKKNQIIIDDIKNISQTAPDQDLTILLDNSGSMRGEPAAVAISWAAIAADLMSGSEVNLEILGFTTRAWKGGLSRELWLSSGKPEYPGRLNDLRHIVYKSYEETYAESLPNFGLMMREGLLKENIDGESILWAKSRIDQRESIRRSILVISDGAPVDDSTLSANNSAILDMHLKQVIEEIRSVGQISLWGAGLNHDVSRYYGEMSSFISTATFPQDFLNILRKVLLS